jgi:hypothetical protein
MLGWECSLYEEFRRCASQLSPADIQFIDDDWDSYFLMQHHGVPTRLLDWSDGALIALYFAVRGKPKASPNDSVIYILDPYWLMRVLDKLEDRKEAKRRWKEHWSKARPADTDEDDWDQLYLPLGADNPKKPLLNTPMLPLLWDSPHVTRRIAAQRSRFMIFGADSKYLAKVEKVEKSRLIAVNIPGTSIGKIRQELCGAGITESVIYPDLDGLGRELKMQWELEN